jgi:general secretion pathway protein F
MPSFIYRARDAAGAIAEGKIDAANRREALRRLQSQGLIPISLGESVIAGATATAGASLSQSKEPGASERLPFLEALDDLVRGGLSAGEGVRLLALRLQPGPLRNLAAGIWSRLGEGQTLSAALASFPKVFDAHSVHLVAAGEATGSLREVLARLIRHYTEQRDFRRRLVAVMAYPVAICLLAAGVVAFFILFLLPRLQSVLTSLGGKLPFSTRLLVGSADVFVVTFPFAVGAIIVGILAIIRWRRTEAGRLGADTLLLRVPIAGAIVTRISVLNFCETLAALLENGITTASALRYAEKTAPNRALRARLRAATDRVLEGESLSRALQRTKVFPILLLDRITVAEQTGNLAPGLRDVAQSYRVELDRWLGGLATTVSSAVLIAAFSTVGFIAYGIVSAIFEVSSSFRF